MSTSGSASEHTIGVRELRQHASRYLAQVAEGQSYIVTMQGRALGELRPVRRQWQSTQEVLDLFSTPTDKKALDEQLQANLTDPWDHL